MRILSGIQPTARQHLGNYYGAIVQFVELQNQGEALYFIANLHSMTTVQDAARRRELTLDVAMTLIACGLDPKRAILFRQSDVPEHSELFWILGTLVPLGHLERAHSYKDKLSHGARADFGLFAYPVLMAADILIYRPDVVPVGKDQKQHVEFARDWATKFNLTYVPGYDPADPDGLSSGVAGVLKLPEPRIQEQSAVVPGLDGQKMSKSYGNAVELFADDDTVKKRILSIKTDSTPVDAPKPVEGNALYALLKLMAPGDEFERLDQSWRSGGQGYGYYKQVLVDLFHMTFDPARKARAELEKDPGEMENMLRDGASRARALAANCMDDVRKA
ncbi:MAG TPA: tryptophan--tRNA ligase, partial [Polyangiaceae bacterium]